MCFCSFCQLLRQGLNTGGNASLSTGNVFLKKPPLPLGSIAKSNLPWSVATVSKSEGCKEQGLSSETFIPLTPLYKREFCSVVFIVQTSFALKCMRIFSFPHFYVFLSINSYNRIYIYISNNDFRTGKQYSLDFYCFQCTSRQLHIFHYPTLQE